VVLKEIAVNVRLSAEERAQLDELIRKPGRNAQQAVVEVGAVLDHGHPEVVDADLADYFGSIPHSELLKSVARRVVDRRVLHLIKTPIAAE
jgi:retron-type reverse transcriptase